MIVSATADSVMTPNLIHRPVTATCCGRFLILAAPALLLAFGVVAPLSAQENDDLEFVTHIPVDFPHYAAIPTNISLYYTDANGSLQAAPTPGYLPGSGWVPGYSEMFFFTQREIYFFNYDPTMTSTSLEPVTWFPNGIPFEGDVGIATSARVSFVQTPTAVLNPSYPATGPAYLYTQAADITGTRNSLYQYDLVQRRISYASSLGLPSSGPLYLPPTAIVETGYYTSIIASAGGIYLQDNRNNPNLGIEVLTPLVTAQGSGPGQLSNPTALNIGPDGLLYVLDYGNNRIESFDPTTGAFHAQFSLAGVTVAPNSLAISANGHIYIGDGQGGGSVFDLAGSLIGTFDPPAGDWTAGDGGLIAGAPTGEQNFLEYDGMGNIFTYTEGEGLMMYKDPTYSAVPEPSTWALLLLGVGGLFILRRSYSAITSRP
jgi:hypothetical protein